MMYLIRERYDRKMQPKTGKSLERSGLLYAIHIEGLSTELKSSSYRREHRRLHRQQTAKMEKKSFLQKMCSNDETELEEIREAKLATIVLPHYAIELRELDSLLYAKKKRRYLYSTNTMCYLARTLVSEDYFTL